jgi:hypothetical protein
MERAMRTCTISFGGCAPNTKFQRDLTYMRRLLALPSANDGELADLRKQIETALPDR